MIFQFVTGTRGPFLVTIFLPDFTPESWVLCFPPFAEEMNKSRTMMSEQARKLAASGVAVVVPDLYGTGDSSGDFCDADWEVWRADMLLLVEIMEQQLSGGLYFWGVRLGCLLALDVERCLDKAISGLLLWQPIINGQQAMNQFLRLRMVAGIMDGVPEKVSDFRNLLAMGKSLEIAGYELSPNLFLSIDELSLQKMKPRDGTKVFWLELSSKPDKTFSPVSQKTLDIWTSGGVDVVSEMLVGDPFWTTQELTMVPALIERSTELVGSISISKISEINVQYNELGQSLLLNEIPYFFSCEGDELSAVLHLGDENAKRGVLIIVGGPQYRVGSHRQFTLLARSLSGAGIPTLRFDYRGMGDSSGENVGFEGITPDIHAAIDSFQSKLPSIEEIVLLGLCDAATAASLYAPTDRRVTGLVLLNPWVRSLKGEAQVYLKYYYLRRLFSMNFWKKVVSGNFELVESLKTFAGMSYKVLCSDNKEQTIDNCESVGSQNTSSLAKKMEINLSIFKGRVLLILSGNDLTAAEFSESVKASRKFTKLVKHERFKMIDQVDADHTFSRRAWRDAVSNSTLKWIGSW